LLAPPINWVFNLADWEIIEANFRLFLVGRYPSEFYWRIWTVLGMVCFLGGASWGIWGRFNRNFAILTGAVTIGLALIIPVEDLAPRIWTVIWRDDLCRLLCRATTQIN
jgi:general L-amino acid transport system permease protein